MPRPRKKQVNRADHSFLSMALVGYEQAKAKIEAEIAAIRKALGAAARSYAKSTAVEEEAPAPKRRKLSAAARKRIGAAQKKRWAAVRAAKKG